MSQDAIQVPMWFKVVVILAVLWNLAGLAAFIFQMTMSAEALAEFPADQQELLKSIPIWSTIAFAFATIGGFVGSVLLFLRKNLAIPVLIASLVGVIIQLGHAYLMTDTLAVFGAAAAARSGMVIVIAILLVFLGQSSKAKGWLS